LAFVRVKTTHSGAITIRKRDANAALKQEWARVGKTWHKKFVPLHFTRTAYSRYNYQKRTKAYTRQKRKKWGHVKPLTWSGTTQKAITAAPTIKSSANKVTIDMAAGNLLNTRKGKYQKAKPIDKRAELLRVTRAEQNELSDQMQRGLDDRIRKHFHQKTRYH